MKKLAVIIVLVAMAAGIAYYAVQHRRLSDRYAETQQAETAVREQFDAALESIAEIQDSLNVILPEEERLSRMSRNAEMGSSVTETQKEQMLGTIDDLKQSVGDTREKIEGLEKTLGKNKTEMAGLRRIENACWDQYTVSCQPLGSVTRRVAGPDDEGVLITRRTEQTGDVRFLNCAMRCISLRQKLRNTLSILMR